MNNKNGWAGIKGSSFPGYIKFQSFVSPPQSFLNSQLLANEALQRVGGVRVANSGEEAWRTKIPFSAGNCPFLVVSRVVEGPLEYSMELHGD